MREVLYVAALTYRRPATLRRLLEALLELELPEADVRFLIVDNDPAASARPLVESLVPRFTGGRLEYVAEAEPGIPAARNRALREAIAGGGAALCFTDDDAFPEPGWLSHLDRCRRATGAALVFGPVRLVPPRVAGVARRLLARSIVARARFIERYATRQARHGRIVTSATSNWMGDLAWIEQRNLYFDERRSAGGGEDTAFCDEVAAHGGHLAWCERAVVHEHLPPERVSVRYQFRRSRANGINSLHLARRPRLVILRHPFGRIIAGLGLMVVPVLGIASFALGLHMLGMGVGMLQARRGAQSDLYSRQRERID